MVASLLLFYGTDIPSEAVPSVLSYAGYFAVRIILIRYYYLAAGALIAIRSNSQEYLEPTCTSRPPFSGAGEREYLAAAVLPTRR